VAGVQAAGVVSLPAQGTLATGMTLNGSAFQSGQPVTVIAVPVGFVLPPQGGSVALPPGSVIAIAGRPELGQITLNNGGTVNLANQPGSLASPLASPLTATLPSGLSVGALGLPPGSQVLVTGLPAGFPTPQMVGITNLPPGTTLIVPGHPELGQFTLSTSVMADLSNGPGTAAALSAPVGAVLTAGLNIAGMNLPSGAQIMVTGLPPGVTVPTAFGPMTLPIGATVSIPGRPDIGQVTLSAPAFVNFNNPGMAGVPPGAPLSPSGGPNLAGQGTLAATLTASGSTFAAGEPIDILNVPSGNILPTGGTITLPIGTVIGIPSRPDLGAIPLSAPVQVTLMPRAAPPVGASGPVMLPSPASGLLTVGINMGPTPLSSGTRIDILGTPPGFVLPQQLGPVTLPPGTVVRFPDRPEMGQIVLNVPTQVDLSAMPGVPTLPAPLAPVQPPSIPAPIQPAPVEELPAPVIPSDLTPLIPSAPELPIGPSEVPIPVAPAVPVQPAQPEVITPEQPAQVGPAPVQLPRR
jgi:hypothetical protein